MSEGGDGQVAGDAATTREPTIRVRLSFNPPTKDRGWNFESTVEPVSSADRIDWDALRTAAERVYEIGEAECVRRDAAEGRERRHFA